MVSTRPMRYGTESTRGSRKLPRVLGLCVQMMIGGAIAISPVRAISADLPPLVSPASPEHHAGKMVFAVLMTPDLVAAERFYANMFSWNFHNFYSGSTLVGQASLNGHVVAAIVQKTIPQGRNPVWRSFLSIGDVDKAAALAVQHGASVLLTPHDLPAIGRDALLIDPQGAVFGMLASSSGDPPDILAAPGEWIWSSLITTDPDTDAAFYGAVFGYDLFKLPDPQDARHLILASDGYARASVNPMPVDRPVSHARWISYVRVTDMTAMSAKLVALGGHVVLAPHADRNGGMIALMSDPAGALFGLLEWSDDVAGDAK